MGKCIRAVNPYRKNGRIYRRDFDMGKIGGNAGNSRGFRQSGDLFTPQVSADRVLVFRADRREKGRFT